MNEITLLQQALAALEYHQDQTRPIQQTHTAIAALRARLAQRPQAAQPAAWIRHEWSGTGQRSLSFDGPPEPRPVRDEVVNPVWTPLYAAPSPARRGPMTTREIEDHIGADEGDREAVEALVREVEAWHGIAATPQPAEAAPKQEAHADDAAVDAFAAAMKKKLALARAKGRGGWQTCSPESLSEMLRDHVEKGDPRDVANFCMFLWSLGAGITAPLPGSEAFDRWVNAGMGVRREAAPKHPKRTAEQMAALVALEDEAGGVFAAGALFDAAPQMEDPVTVPRGLLGAACAAIARKHDAPKTLEQLRRYTVGDLSRVAEAAPKQSSVAGPVEPKVGLQGGLTNDQLRVAWLRALPGVQPTERDLTAFALGVECGASLLHRWEVVTWSSRTTRTFDTRQEALDYLTMNDTDGDWHLRPVLSEAEAAPKQEAGKILLSLADLKVLAETAERNGTQHAFQAVALEWCGKAQAEIERLRALLARALASMEQAVHWAETGKGRPPQQTCLFEIEDISAALSAQPQQPAPEPVAACPHQAEPRGCYRVRCQLGRKCVEAGPQTPATPGDENSEGRV